MPGTTINPSLSFDPFATPYGAADSIYPDFSPDSLFDSYEDFGTDFHSDSTGSPISPISPVLSSSSFGLADDWMTWENIDQASPANGFLKTEPVDGSILASVPARTLSMSPAVNPMDLNMPANSMNFLSDAMVKPLPLFQPSGAPLQQPITYASRTPQPQIELQAAPTATQRRNSRGLKRKSSTSTSDDEAQSPPPSLRRAPAKKEKEDTQRPKKTAHNMIEKRYRTNLNEKIAQLRDSVPALRVVAQRLDHEEDGADDDDLSNLAPAPKLNKATILSKATEYIAQLEKRNRGLETENNLLRGRMEGLEMLMMNRGAGNLWN